MTLLLRELVHHHQLFPLLAVEMVFHHLNLCLEIVILSLLDLERCGDILQIPFIVLDLVLRVPQGEGILAYFVLHLLDELLLLRAFLVHTHHIGTDRLFHGREILQISHEVLILRLYPEHLLVLLSHECFLVDHLLTHDSELVT